MPTTAAASSVRGSRRATGESTKTAGITFTTAAMANSAPARWRRPRTAVANIPEINAMINKLTCPRDNVMPIAPSATYTGPVRAYHQRRLPRGSFGIAAFANTCTLYAKQAMLKIVHTETETPNGR
jgi:hypothetical protein